MADSEGRQQAEMKRRIEENWAKAAASYSEWVIENRLLARLYPRFEEWLVPRLKDVAGARILDVASASGEPAVTLAAALPQAQVVSTDIAAPFQELGRARAAKAGLGNVCFETADAEDLHKYADASFDAVTCSLGLMFLPNLAAALREFARVLKPGGLFAATVWMAEERMPFFLTVKALAMQYDPATVLVAANMAVRFGDPAGLLQQLGGAGLADGRAGGIEVDYYLPAHLWWKALLELPLPIQPALAKAQAQRPDDDVFEEGRLKMLEMARQQGWLTDGGDLHCKDNGCWFVTARKPAA